MRLPVYFSAETKRPRPAARSAFTLVELMIASSIALVAAGGAMIFMNFAGVSISGITSQCIVIGQAGNAIELIQSSARLATSASNDASGNVLTLGFDDDAATDSNGDGKAYNDQNHFEQFQFLSVTNGGVSTNSLIYIPDTTATNNRVLIKSGMRKLPGWNVFTVTNGGLVLIRFGVLDSYVPDHYQSTEIQASAVPLNRPAATNVISIYP